MTSNPTAIILALGTASRMRPLSCFRPKALLPFCGRPLLEYTLEALLHHGIRNVILVAGVEETGFQPYEAWGAELGLTISVARQSLEHGSAGVVKKVARERVRAGDDVLVIYGDSLISIDLRGLVDAHQAHRGAGCRATLAYHAPADLIVPGQAQSPYGLMWIDDDQTIRRFSEKPPVAHASTPHANAGVYVLDTSLLSNLSDKQALDFSRDVFEPLAASPGAVLRGYDLGRGFRYDIGTLEEYAQKQFAVLRGEIVVPGIPWPWIRNNSSFTAAACSEGKTLIRPDCAVGKNVSFGGYNVIGRQVSIGADAAIRGCVILDNTTVGPAVKLTGAVIGMSCRIAAGVVLGPGSVLGDFSILNSMPDNS